MSSGQRRASSIADLEGHEFIDRLRGRGLGVRIGPYDIKLRCDVPSIEEPLRRLYRHYPLLDGERVFGAHLRLTRSRSLPRILKPRVRFTVDGRAPHEDLPRAHALAVLEWGLNLVIAMRSHTTLMLHAAAAERNGGVLLLPAWPGHGKTTLCTALVHRGWRLFSDEFGIVSLGSGELLPLPRPMPLKNDSIAVIRDFAPEAELGPVIRNTRKGTIAHVKPPEASILAAANSGRARWIVFPRWTAGAALALEPLPKAESFMTLATNAFNYEILGEAGFLAVKRLVESTRTFRLVYSDLQQAVTVLEELAGGHDR